MFTVLRGQNARQGRGPEDPESHGAGRRGHLARCGDQDPESDGMFWSVHTLAPAVFIFLYPGMSCIKARLTSWPVAVEAVREIKISLRKNSYIHFISWTSFEAKSIKSSDSRKGRLSESFAANSSSFILFIEIYH